MADFIVMQIVGGNAFFIGIIIVVVASLCRLAADKRLWKVTARIMGIIGVTFVVVSATPLPLWAYLAWFILFAAAFAPQIKFLSHRANTGFVLSLILLSMAMGANELRYRFTPAIPLHHGQTIYVIGDSISAGIGKEKTWPQVLRDHYGFDVVNLAQAGATVESASRQLRGVQRSNAVVILEIGGNDFFGATKPAEFTAALDRLLSALAKQGHTLVMFELPLLPFHNDFGAAQRILARKHDVVLLPKTYMARLFGTPGATLDGLHLSEAGHRAMAAMVYETLRIQ